MRTEYDDVGNPTAIVDQNDARIESRYDMLNRVRTRTQIVRDPDDVDPPVSYVTDYEYDDLGNQTSMTNPEHEITTSVFDAASRRVQTNDPTGAVTVYDYQLDRQTRVTDPDGRAVESVYDLAGRMTFQYRYGADGTLETTTGFGYDEAGNQTQVTSANGYEQGADPVEFTTVTAYNPLNWPISVTQPTSASHSIVTGYVYDPAGNLKTVTDGEGHEIGYGYNPWNLRTTTIEAVTDAYPDEVDGTWTVVYDAGGLPVNETQPGGVTITRVFDELGRLTSETGTGDGDAVRSFGYDLVGNRTAISHPSGPITLRYDDRRLLVSVSGPAGTTSVEYDGAGRMTGRSDDAGVYGFTWTDRGELDTITDPLTGTVIDYDWTDSGLVDTVTYGTNGVARDYTYTNLGRLQTDVLTDPTGEAVASVAYGYDPAGNLVSKDVQLPANPDAVINTYDYDNANRLISWTGSTATTGYTWDDAGNRLTAGTDTYTYDERNQLLTGPEGDCTYTPRGTLVSISDGAVGHTYDYDSLGRLVGYDTVGYTYDGLDRVATRNTEQFTYTGVSLDPTTDGDHTYGRTPAGNIIAIGDGTTAVLAGRDRHGDLTHLFDPTTGQVTDTAMFDPFGAALATTGTMDAALGYQSDWTDPDSEHTWMGSRWYDGGWANFLSRDTVFGELRTPISLNRYTYANNNPLTYWDPDGRLGISVDGLGSGSSFTNIRKSTGEIHRKTKLSRDVLGRLPDEDRRAVNATPKSSSRMKARSSETASSAAGDAIDRPKFSFVIPPVSPAPAPTVPGVAPLPGLLGAATLGLTADYWLWRFGQLSEGRPMTDDESFVGTSEGGEAHQAWNDCRSSGEHCDEYITLYRLTSMDSSDDPTTGYFWSPDDPLYYEESPHFVGETFSGAMEALALPPDNAYTVTLAGTFTLDTIEMWQEVGRETWKGDRYGPYDNTTAGGGGTETGVLGGCAVAIQCTML